MLQVVEQPNVVLLIGSAPDAVRCVSLPKSSFRTIVAINNAWRVRPDWDVLVHAGDFPEERLPGPHRPPYAKMVSAAEYVPAQNLFGGFVYAGPTMAFTAAYWALATLRPDFLLFVGCDMIYQPIAGRTHFYGTGTADPLRRDKTLNSLEAKSARLFIHALRQDAICLNLSDLPSSRLLFPRLPSDQLAELPKKSRAVWHRRLVQRIDWTSVEKAQAREVSLGYFVEDGRYWRHLDLFDGTALDDIDKLWLASFAGIPVPITS